MTNECKEYKGYSLFNDITDKALRIRNRGVVMANMAIDGKKGTGVGAGAAADLFKYLGYVDQAERKDVLNAFITRMNEEGYKVETSV